MELITAKYCLKLILFGAVLLGLICRSNAALTRPTIALTTAATTTALPRPKTGPTEKPTAVSVSATANPTAAPTVSAKTAFASTARPTNAPAVSPTFQLTITYKPTSNPKNFAPARPPLYCNISSGDLDALEFLYNSTNGAKWLWRPNIYKDSGANWTFPAQVSDPCSLNWQGVTCKQVSNGKCKVCQILVKSSVCCGERQDLE